MAGVGPGTTIAGRYALRTLVHRAPQGQRWAAHDTRTGVDVEILLVPSASPVAQAVVDAGRRAAVLEDPRLTRVSDVGEDAGHAYVVERTDETIRTLRDQLEAGPLAPEEARRVVGEASLALERARQRGLHHQRLTPSHIGVGRRGQVVVRGLAVDAALASADTDGRTASRTDAAGLAACLYAALTATWPLTGTDLTSAPRVGRSLVRPSDLAPGIAEDLDAAALAGQSPDGPAIPGDVAELLAPWSDKPVERLVDAGPPADTKAPPAQDFVDPTALPDELRGDIEHPPSKAAVAAGAVAAGVAAGSRATADAAKAAAKAAADRAAERRRENLERREAEKASERSFTQIAEESPAEPERVVPVLARDVTTAVPSRNQAKFVLGFMASFIGLALLLGLLGIANAVATIQHKVSLGAGPTPTMTVTAPAVTVTAGAPATSKATAKPTPTPSAVPVPIVGVTTFDPPPGDGTENESMASNVTDGNPATIWRSSRYDTANFSGLKPGVGLLLDLGQKTSVRSAKLTIPDTGVGEDVTVYVTDERPQTVDGLQKLGSATAVSGQVTITSAANLGEHQYVLVWFTKAAPVSGGFRASLADVALSS